MGEGGRRLSLSGRTRQREGLEVGVGEVRREEREGGGFSPWLIEQGREERERR